MKRIVVISSVVIVLLLVGLGIGLTTRSNNNDKAPQKTEVVKRGDFVIKINASGNLESLLSVEVKSNVEGEIEKLNVKDGDFIEKGSILLQIDDEQIKEEMKQAEANVSAAEAQLEQSKRSLAIKKKQLDSELLQQGDSVAQAKINYNFAKVTTLQQISQQETNILNTKEAWEQDKIALRQAEIASKQAALSLSEAEQSETAAKVNLDNADSEMKRTQKLYAKEFVSKKALEDAQASYANASSSYENAKKRVLSQKESVQSQKENIDHRQRAIQMRETTLKFEKQNLELLKQTRAAQEEQSLTQLKSAQTRLTQLEDSIDDEKDISGFSLESAKANLLRAESTLNNQKERLEWTTILAPMSGRIINLQIEEGEIVTSGRSAFSQSPPIMEIVDLSQMVVKTFINEVDMEKLALGQKAEIQLRAYPKRTYRGEVREISPSGQARDNIIYFEVLIAVLGSPEELRPGMTADVDIVVVERKEALLLPIAAVKSDRSRTAKDGHGKTSANPRVANDTISNAPASRRAGQQYYVMLVPDGEESDAAKSNAIEGVKTFIEVGEQNDLDIEVLGGLSEGDRVLVPEASQERDSQSDRRRRR